MLLRRGASLVLPGWAWPLWADVAAAAAARLIAVSSRRALAAGCASSASRRQKVQAVLLLQLLELAYWLPATRALWTIFVALRSSAWSGAPLLQAPALRALAVCTLCCERWWLHCELLNTARKHATAAACQPLLLSAGRQVEHEFGCWPLHAVRRLLYTMSPQVCSSHLAADTGLSRPLGCRAAYRWAGQSPDVRTAGLGCLLTPLLLLVQAAPHLATSCLRAPAVTRMYALAEAPELTAAARNPEGNAGERLDMALACMVGPRSTPKHECVSLAVSAVQIGRPPCVGCSLTLTGMMHPEVPFTVTHIVVGKFLMMWGKCVAMLLRSDSQGTRHTCQGCSRCQLSSLLLITAAHYN